MKKTIRLLIPQWKGGVNPDYVFGARILAEIAPANDHEKLIEVNIKKNDRRELKEEHKIIAGNTQLEELNEIKRICREEDPDKIIIFGGDCSVSQGPFDFLSEKYGNSLGIIWLDSHPDISTIKMSNHNHELVLASIMGKGDSIFSENIATPVSSERIIYAELVEDPTEKLKQLEENLEIKIINPVEVITDNKKLKNWIEKNNIGKLCVHFDLDVLSPDDFRSLTSSKPYQTPEDYGAAIGKLKLKEVVDFLNKANSEAEIVGLSIAEFIPWDLINLKEAMGELPIFTQD